jgi:hypothetical protein
MAKLQSSLLATLIVTCVAAGAGGGCDDPPTATGLHPEGPPKVQQVFLKELYTEADQLRVRTILAYGTHDNIPDEREHPTTTAATNDQTIRVVFDEILRGNALEEIRCQTRMLSETTACVVPGGWSRVPIGATPDDIADCAVADDLLDESCAGPMATCLNEDGIPCGVFDENQAGQLDDGSADEARLIAGQVRIMCGSVDVPLGVVESYWQPAGNQLVPARQVPEGSLGPALILRPANEGRMPTNSDCRLILAPDVVDKDDIQVCAPPGGDPAADCTPGDLSAFSFHTDPLRLTSSSPEPDTTGVATSPATIQTFWSAPIDVNTVQASVTVTPALVAPVVTLSTNLSSITITSATPFAPSTMYTVTFTGLADSFGVPLPAPVSFSFTTAAL